MKLYPCCRLDSTTPQSWLILGVDPCAMGHDCEHTCVNSNASYYCKCRNGYILNADKKTCSLKRKNLRVTMILIFTNGSLQQIWLVDVILMLWRYMCTAFTVKRSKYTVSAPMPHNITTNQCLTLSFTFDITELIQCYSNVVATPNSQCFPYQSTQVKQWYSDGDCCMLMVKNVCLRAFVVL